MKMYLTLFFLMIAVGVATAQIPCPDCPPNGADKTVYDVITLDSRMEFVPGEIIVRFKDEVTPLLGKANGIVSFGISSVDAIMQKFNVTAVEKVFAGEVRKTEKVFFKSYTGVEFEAPNLHNIHKLQMDTLANIFEAIEALRQDENVLYAEPNYILSVVESEPVSPVLTESEMLEWVKNNPEVLPQFTPSPNSVVPNDPLYSQQWGIPETQIDAVWDSTTGSTDQILAILDTGVDMLHPDLTNKIWINAEEIPGNGIDDDGNGYVDDVNGWDWINHDNSPMDDNSHGTHVAGIAAAETNNGIGVAGVNWNAKIMPLKVFQSSGRGDVATITQGIIYAKNMGASVINMSFGSYTRSLAMEDALANAYATSVLVAAAGNDGGCIGPGPGCAPFFPAALSFVLGTEASVSGGSLAGFSNFDQDGPIFSNYEDLLNYELRAPGANIIGCVPNGGYRVFHGTSMAAPLLSGSVSLYRKIYPQHSQELMWGNFINSSAGHIQLFDAVTVVPEPVLMFVNKNIVDTLDGDNDGIVDAGETIELWFTLRNTWGQDDSVWCGIRFGEFEDTSTAQILESESFIGSISPYATRTNELNPLKIKINPNVVHDRDIVFEGLLWYSGAPDTVKQSIVFTVKHGTELSGVIADTLILTPDKQWLITRSFKIAPTGVLILKPGTKLYSERTIVNDGLIIAEGKKDSVVQIEVNTSDFLGISGSPGQLNFVYTKLAVKSYQSAVLWQKGTIINSLILLETAQGFSNANSLLIEDVLFANFIGNVLFISNYASYCVAFNRCNFNNIQNNHFFLGGNSKINYSNFAKFNPIIDKSLFAEVNSNNFLDSYKKVIYQAPPGYLDHAENQYWGTSDSVKITQKIIDFWDDPTLALTIFWPYRTAPSDSAHGVVWKVLVNGKDAQDEYVDPLGVGTHRFDVYFNRPMDTSYAPQLSFGVREPYNQSSVTDSARWSADRKIWTAYHTVKLYSGDGINRIRVAGARDDEDWEILLEDERFEFLIDAAGSASADFQATPGLGRVNLEWRTPDRADVPDLLGYNMYRLEHITDTTLTAPVMINSYLITDTLFTDFNVIPNEKYYYFYRVVRTDFSESDSSKVVNAIPFTAAVGDANGDLTINILDITSIVNFLLNQNPQPFIFAAADVNTDGQVNILDVVGVVNIIMGNTSPLAKQGSGVPRLSFDTKTAYLENGEGLAGLQFKMTGKDLSKSSLILGEAGSGMELSYHIDGDTMYAVLFSFKNQTIAKGEKSVLFKLNGGTFSEVKQVTGSSIDGNKVEIALTNDGDIIPKEYTLYQNYPNPFNPNTTIRYALPNVEDVDIAIYDILGQKVWDYRAFGQQPGYYEIMWNSRNNFGTPVSSGIYIYQIKAGKFITQKKMVLLK